MNVLLIGVTHFDEVYECCIKPIAVHELMEEQFLLGRYTGMLTWQQLSQNEEHMGMWERPNLEYVITNQLSYIITLLQLSLYSLAIYVSR